MNGSTFFDKVYACWMGKNIGGTLGGPLEGRMELMDIKGYTQTFVESVENDDLDLQLVNLHCVEQYGGRADSALLSREWLEHVHFEYDEYGHALTNMRRGLGSPLSGSYNNFFTDCMGSPIRSEIWAVICAGMPDLAAYYAYQDASVDHAGGEGIYGEIFFAVLESMAFVETDKMTLIDRALSYLPKECNVHQAVSQLVDCYKQGMDWVSARALLIDRFAGDNFTYAPLNIAFTLVGWLYEEGFTAQMLTTINCGYDTDCTVATLGSLLGILYGTAYLDPYWTEPLGEKIIASRPITGFNTPRTITELTERSIAARKLVQAHYEQADKASFTIPYQSDVEVYRLPMASFKEHDLELTLSRCPVFTPGETGTVTVRVKNMQPIVQELTLIPSLPGFSAQSAKLSLEAGECGSVTLQLTAPLEKASLWRGQLEIRRSMGGLLWNSEFVPLSAFPSMDWTVEVGGRSAQLQLKENRICAHMLPACGDRIRLSTHLTLEDSGAAELLLVCSKPVRAWIDGEPVIDSSDRTIVIPAYHRADRKKCARLSGSAGSFALTVEVGDAADFDELYFFVVSPAFYFAYRLDSIFSAK